MHISIAQTVSLKIPPLAIFYAQEPPSEAKKLKSICSMLLVAQAAKGKTVSITRGTCRCPGADKGLGLEPSYHDTFPGGGECFLHFFPTRKQDLEHGQVMIQKLTMGGAPIIMADDHPASDHLLSPPENMKQRLDNLPCIQPEAPYLVIKPLEAMAFNERPKVVTLLIEPDQLPAIERLANLARPGIENVWTPYTAGCASMALYPLYEAEQANPRAVIGLTDTSTRFYLRKTLGMDVVSFTIPWNLFEKMESYAAESLLTHCA